MTKIKLDKRHNLILLVLLAKLFMAAFSLGRNCEDILRSVMFWLLGWLGHSTVKGSNWTTNQPKAEDEEEAE